jgi:hypothetical protein
MPMSQTLGRIIALVARGEVRVFEHGYEELAADGILVHDLVAGIRNAELVEDYPDFAKGPCVLVLQQDRDGHPVHVVWGIPKDETGPAVLVTAYRPDPQRWSDDLRRRMT